MSYDTLASDWEYAGMCQIGAAETLGAGFYSFSFRSRTAGVREDVYFSGGGIGIGGNVGGSSMVDLSNGQLSYSAIQCVREFNLHHLHNAIGRVTAIGVSLAVGYGQMYISASSGFDELFTCQGGHGLSVGVGVGATCFFGLWRVARFCNTDQ